MDKMNRQGFIKVAGAGSVAAAAAGLPLAGKLGAKAAPTAVSFRAAAGLPKSPLPGYATQLVEGTVDLAAGTGTVTTRVVAGHPEDTGTVGLPGLSRIIRVTAVSGDAKRYVLTGHIDDRSQLARGESAKVTIVVDHRREIVHAPFLGRQTEHLLAA
jgi:hypothetical protein